MSGLYKTDFFTAKVASIRIFIVRNTHYTRLLFIRTQDDQTNKSLVVQITIIITSPDTFICSSVKTNKTEYCHQEWLSPSITSSAMIGFCLGAEIYSQLEVDLFLHSVGWGCWGGAGWVLFSQESILGCLIWLNFFHFGLFPLLDTDNTKTKHYITNRKSSNINSDRDLDLGIGDIFKYK